MYAPDLDDMTGRGSDNDQTADIYVLIKETL